MNKNKGNKLLKIFNYVFIVLLFFLITLLLIDYFVFSFDKTNILFYLFFNGFYVLAVPCIFFYIIFLIEYSLEHEVFSRDSLIGKNIRRLPFYLFWISLIIITISLIIDIKFNPLDDKFDDKSFPLDITTSLLSLIISASSLMISFSKDEIYGLNRMEFSTIKNSTWWNLSLYEFIVITVISFILTFWFQLKGYYLSLIVVEVITSFFIVYDLIFEIPLLLKSKFWINQVFKYCFNRYIELDGEKYKLVNFKSTLFELIKKALKNMIIKEGLEKTLNNASYKKNRLFCSYYLLNSLNQEIIDYSINEKMSFSNKSNFNNINEVDEFISNSFSSIKYFIFEQEFLDTPDSYKAARLIKEILFNLKGLSPRIDYNGLYDKLSKEFIRYISLISINEESLYNGFCLDLLTIILLESLANKNDEYFFLTFTQRLNNYYIERDLNRNYLFFLISYFSYFLKYNKNYDKWNEIFDRKIVYTSSKPVSVFEFLEPLINRYRKTIFSNIDEIYKIYSIYSSYYLPFLGTNNLYPKTLVNFEFDYVFKFIFINIIHFSTKSKLNTSLILFKAINNPSLKEVTISTIKDYLKDNRQYNYDLLNKNVSDLYIDKENEEFYKEYKTFLNVLLKWYE